MITVKAYVTLRDGTVYVHDIGQGDGWARPNSMVAGLLGMDTKAGSVAYPVELVRSVELRTDGKGPTRPMEEGQDE